MDITKRERECLNLIVRGYNNREMAELMRCSIHTIKVYIANMLYKTNSKNKANLVYNILKTRYKFPDNDL